MITGSLRYRWQTVLEQGQYPADTRFFIDSINNCTPLVNSNSQIAFSSSDVPVAAFYYDSTTDQIIEYTLVQGQYVNFLNLFFLENCFKHRF